MLTQYLCIHVLDPPVECMDPGMITESPPANMITVKGENLQLHCSVCGFVLCYFPFYSTWNISLPYFNGTINIHDNFTDPNYYLAIYQTEEYCVFINQLIIRNVSFDLNGAILTCIESTDEYGSHLISAFNVTLSE